MAVSRPDTRRMRLGNWIAPPRFVAFGLLILVGAPLGIAMAGWRIGSMIAFDVAAAVFLLSLYPLFRSEPADMRDSARRNDANRLGLLVVTGIVMLAVMVAVAAELGQQGKPSPPEVICVVATLSLAWLFSNMIYALHYAHLFYTADPIHGGRDSGGIDFPDTDEPDYSDFVYFAYCLGMTFQTSDVDIRSRRFRKVVTAHCLAAFVFNLGVIAFTINVLGGG